MSSVEYWKKDAKNKYKNIVAAGESFKCVDVANSSQSFKSLFHERTKVGFVSKSTTTYPT
jgi:hypothetical protein